MPFFLYNVRFSLTGVPFVFCYRNSAASAGSLADECDITDEELTAKSYIVPGLGDAGDLLFGEKVQD